MERDRALEHAQADLHFVQDVLSDAPAYVQFRVDPQNPIASREYAKQFAECAYRLRFVAQVLSGLSLDLKGK